MSLDLSQTIYQSYDLDAWSKFEPFLDDLFEGRKA